MIASILPGLRDLRVPLASGFLWLTALWLIIYPLIPSRADATGFAAEIYRLLGAFGPAAPLAVSTFVAYVVGIVVGQVSYYALLPIKVARIDNSRLMSISTREQAFGLAESVLDRLQESAVSATRVERIVSAGTGFRKGRVHVETSGPLSGDDAKLHPDLVGYLQVRMSDEVPLVAARLLARSKELFDRYDRADAEANFRFAIITPLAVVVLLAAFRLNLFSGWLSAAITIAILGIVILLILRDGLQKRRESNDAVHQAVFIKEANFPVIEELENLLKTPS